MQIENKTDLLNFLLENKIIDQKLYEVLFFTFILTDYEGRLTIAKAFENPRQSALNLENITSRTESKITEHKKIVQEKVSQYYNQN